MRSFKLTVYGCKQTGIATHTHVQCSLAGVGLAQACPNSTVALHLYLCSPSQLHSFFPCAGDKDHPRYVEPPVIPGHEFIGEVVKLGRGEQVTYLPRCQVSSIYVLAFNIMRRSRTVAISKQTSKKGRPGKSYMYYVNGMRMTCETGLLPYPPEITPLLFFILL